MKKSVRQLYYFRISTQGQATDSTISHYINRGVVAGFQEGFNIYYDVGSGRSTDRENYQLILNKVKEGLVDEIYLPNDLSRLMRSVEEFKKIQRVFTEAKVKLLDLNGNQYKFIAPEEILLSDIQMSFNEYESNRNKYRSKIGHQYIRDNGLPLRPMFPYIKNEDKTQFIPNEAEYKDSGKTCWEVGRELVLLYIETGNLSLTIKTMMKRYGADKVAGVGNDYPRDHSGFRDYLRSETLRGNLHYFGGRRYKRLKNPPEEVIVYGCHTPLITPDEDIDIRKRLGKRTVSRGQVRNPLAGKLFCGACGSPMKVSRCKTSAGNTISYIICKSAYPNSSEIKARQDLGLDKACNARSSYGMTLEKLVPFVIDELCQKADQIASATYPITTQEPVNPELLELQKQIETYRKLSEADVDLLPLLQKKEKRLAYLLNNQPERQEPLKREKFLQYGGNKDFWSVATTKELKMLFNDLIERVDINKGRHTITWTV